MDRLTGCGKADTIGRRYWRAKEIRSGLSVL